MLLVVGVWSQPEHPDWFPDVNVIAFDQNGQITYSQGVNLFITFMMTRFLEKRTKNKMVRELHFGALIRTSPRL